MPKATEYQKKLIKLLRKYFNPTLIKKEWDISKNATDIFRHRPAIYAPRLDIAVGLFNINRDNSEENKHEIFLNKRKPLIKKLLDRIDPRFLNKNPRCLLAIEVSFSGTSKHFMGDLINASMMGLIGIVITNDKNEKKISKISKYLTALQGVEKLPFNLCGNVLIFHEEDLVSLIK